MALPLMPKPTQIPGSSSILTTSTMALLSVSCAAVRRFSPVSLPASESISVHTQTLSRLVHAISSVVDFNHTASST